MTNPLPSDLKQMTIVTKYEIVKYLRGRKLLVFGGLVALILVLLTAMPALLGQQLPQDAMDFMLYYMQFITILIILAVTLFAADSLASEYEYRTGLLLFPRPMKREALFAGKFIASFLVSALMIAAFYVVVFIMSYVVTGDVVSEAYTSLGVAMLYVLAATGFGYLLSAFMARGNTAAILLFASLLLILPIIDSVLMFANVEPVLSLTFSGDAVYYVIEGSESMEIMPGFTLFIAKLNTAVPVLAGWAVATTAIAALKFKRREF